MTDSRSFEQLFEEAQADLLAWCHLRMTGALRRRLEPEDVINEVWVRSRSKFSEFEAGRGSFVQWLIGYARIVCIEGLRKAAREPSLEVVTGPEGGNFAVRARSTLSVRSRLANEEAFANLMKTLAGLREEERELIARLTYEDATCAQVAQSWGKTEDAVSKKWQRLRSSLRECAEARTFLALD